MKSFTDVCNVCLDHGLGKKTICNHFFCDICLKKWKEMTSSFTCPCCRQPLSRKALSKLRLENSQRDRVKKHLLYMLELAMEKNDSYMIYESSLKLDRHENLK